MLKLENICAGLQVVGLVPDEVATIIQSVPAGADALTVYYKTATKPVTEQVVFREDEESLALAESGLAWSFDAPGREFSLALEAYRIQLGHLFDPMMAVHASNVEPLPHQISAVYETMLNKQPLRFVLADDPGAGKTVMAGLLIKELMLRGDAKRILIVAPGSLTEQWQDEMREKFGTEFKLLTPASQNDSPTGNFFADEDRVIARVDMLSRNDELKKRLEFADDWDLIIVDEAHKLSAHLVGREIKKTMRYQLGELLGSKTRHFLLMTATPHNGKEEDFQVWMSLLDRDRFAGRALEDVRPDVSDMMRRLVKEELLRFDGTRLFPKRLAYTVNYPLSESEKALYEAVTKYVRNEMNRAESLTDGKKKNCVGFALTMLQRRLASSPAAIYLSIKRRVERLEKKVAEYEDLLARGLLPQRTNFENRFDDDFDPDEDLTGEEQESLGNEIIDSSTAANSIPEFMAEVEILKGLEKLAKEILDSKEDRKWSELRKLFEDDPLMFREDGSRRKIIIFTEHRDTLDYLAARIGNYLGRNNAVVTISGSTDRVQRRAAQDEFRTNKDVVVLIATDAAGEGVNLQNANLMVNYDLPWNPNRLEQRFGRIHRIGQREVCHLWNLVAFETREGEVFHTLFAKLEQERQTLGGRVFDILGEAFEGTSLKNLLIDAIRLGETPEMKAYMTEKVHSALDTGHLREIMKRNSLVAETMSREALYRVKEQMDRAEAKKLQPCYVCDFLRNAMAYFGGDVRPREDGRYEIPRVPECIRANEKALALTREHVSRKYQRICFDKKFSHLRADGSDVRAEFVYPGHPLMLSLTDYTLDRTRQYLKPGAVMVDPADDGVEPSLLFMVDHAVRESDGDGIASRRLQFVRLTPDGTIHAAGWAPHLDLEPGDAAAKLIAVKVKREPWLTGDIESRAVAFATGTLAKDHFDEVRELRVAQVEKVRKAVWERLTTEIAYYDQRAIELQRLVDEGKQPRLQPGNMQKMAEDLNVRLTNRIAELNRRKNVISGTPTILGGILVIPQGLVNRETGAGAFCADDAARKKIEKLAMDAVMAVERRLGNTPMDVSKEKIGWDVTSVLPSPPEGVPSVPDRHIEVKGRVRGANTVTVTKNEVCTAVNQQDKFILAICIIDGEKVDGPYYVRKPFEHEMDCNVVSQNYSLEALLAKSEKMS